jgi:hypothetical protein
MALAWADIRAGAMRNQPSNMRVILECVKTAAARQPFKTVEPQTLILVS